VVAPDLTSWIVSEAIVELPSEMLRAVVASPPSLFC